MNQKGHRSVLSVSRFCGWNFLLNLISRCSLPRDEALVAAMFETGGRVSEVLQLESSNFRLEGDYLIVSGMPVLKRKCLTFRSFPLPRQEPLVPYLMRYLYNHEGRLFDLTRNHAYRILVALDKQVYPHWFRAQRASQLAEEYGFHVQELMEWFCWQEAATAVRYAHHGWAGLASKIEAAKAYRKDMVFKEVE